MPLYSMGRYLAFNQVHFSSLQILFLRRGLLLAQKGVQYTHLFSNLCQSYRGERAFCSFSFWVLWLWELE